MTGFKQGFAKALFGAALACASGAALAQTTTLKIATLAPDGTAWMQTMRHAADTVAERTQDRVKVRFYPGGVMGNDRTVLRKIRIGQLHGAAFTGGELGMEVLEFNVYSVPFLFRDQDEVDAVRAEFDARMEEAAARQGWMTTGVAEGGFAYLMSSAPVTGVDDLKNRKVWIPQGDRVAAKAFEVAGVPTIALTIAEVYAGLQTQLLDTVINTPQGAIALQWHSRLSSVTDTPMSYVFGTIAFSERAMRRVDNADRQVLEAEFRKAMAAIDKVSRADNAGARAALQAQGMQFLPPEPAELQRWEGIAARTVEELQGQKAYAEDFLRQIQSFLDDYRSSAAP
jgi:TRAP-type C4-dicarboxylate transport system substrate-binding protein